ncbi:MAG: HD domain-containing protein [Thaumarchaeota archaeon]|nr:HD domain-containing protein [Nitrososphaerota archaeon]
MRSIEKLKEEVKKLVRKNDPAHDFEHVMRVYRNSEKIGKREGARMKLLLSAALLHDIVSIPKSDRKSSNSSLKSAILAQKILKRHGYSRDEIGMVSGAIRDHSFSRGKVPETIEGRVLQDADRLDAIGAIGIARAFSVGGRSNRPFYSKLDPFCQRRRPDDQKWTLDHFYKKLLILEKMMNTKTAKIEAKRRTKIMQKYLNDLKKEIYP